MKKRKIGRVVFWILLALAVLALTGVIVGMNLAERSLKAKESRTAETETSAETQSESETTVEAGMVPKPEISEQLLTVNSYSRPGTKLEAVNYIVIHYLGNPDTTAQQNRDYFESLKELQDTHMSANFIVGLDGEIIQCVPEDEVAYASNQENDDSISIENCHIDETGKLLSDTYFSLVKLTAYLVDKYDLTREQIIRHYDVTGKECPLYYVENEDDWETFRDDVMTYVELCQSYTVSDEELKKTLQGLAHTYSDRSEKQTEEETEDTEPETEASENYEESYEGSDQSSDTQGYDPYQYQPPAYTPDTGTTYTETTAQTTADTQAATDASTADTSAATDSGTTDTGTTSDDSATTSDDSSTTSDDSSTTSDDSASDSSAEAPVDAPVDD